MDKYCTQIDNNGYVIATHLLSEAEISNFEGILLVDIEPPKGVILVDRPLKPKWDGKKWVEGASDEEISDYINSKPKPQPSEIEKLRLEQAQANSELVQLIMMMGGA